MLFQPPASHLLSIPHVEQRNSGDCLAACAAMVCQYLGVAVQYDQLVKLLEIKPGIGAPFSHIEKLNGLQHLIVTHRTGGTLAQLFDLLSLGWPIITSVQTGDLSYWEGRNMLHAVVVVGMEPGNVFIDDPGIPGAPSRVSIGDFDLAWLAQDERYAVLSR